MIYDVVFAPKFQFPNFPKKSTSQSADFGTSRTSGKYPECSRLEWSTHLYGGGLLRTGPTEDFRSSFRSYTLFQASHYLPVTF